MFGQFMGDLGIPIHSREFAKALNKQCELNLVQIIAPLDKTKIEKELADRFGKIDFNRDSLTFWYPNVFDSYSVSSKRNLGYYIFEYTKIPKPFVQEMNKLDGICTASKWGVQTLKDNGVKVPCYIVHGGVSDRFKYMDRNQGDTDIFRFLHIGKAENRKGTELLIKSFVKAFGGNPSIRLTLSIDNPHIKDFDSALYIYGQTDVGNIDPIHFVADINELYKKHDCAIFPTRAEGIGLPIIESMGTGLPVIVSDKTGMSEYINKENAIVLEDTEKVPVYDKMFFPNAGEFGEWDSPKEDELIDKMRWVYKNYNEAKTIGNNAAKWIKENYTWDLAATKFIEEVL